MKKIITLMMSVLLALFSLFASGCFVEDRAPTGSFGIEGDSSGGEAIDPDADPFTVTLHTTDGGKLPSLSGISVIWTEVNGVNIHQSSFNGEGVAANYQADGEYQVTLSSTPEGYTYNPNIYFADNDSNDKIIDLYPLRDFTGGGDGGQPPHHYKVSATGAYRFTFENASQELYFSFGVEYSGKMAFQSLLDVTANEVSPIFYECYGTHLPKVKEEVKGGGEANSYTKNFYTLRDLTDSQAMLFKIGVETVNPNAFPASIDVLIQKEGEYTESGSNLEKVATPSDLIDYGQETPTGSFVHFPRTTANYLDESKVVYDSAEDRYYVKGADGQADKTKMLYARLKKDIPGILATDSGTGLSYPLVRHTCHKAGKDYTQFIQAYFARCNTDGSYPVNAALKEYLQDFSIANQYFYDGNGSADGPGGEFDADNKSFWLFACGYYE